MRYVSLLFSLLLAHAALAENSGEVRAWTNNKGQTIQGKMISIADDTVTIKIQGGKRDGKEFAIKLTDLCEDDREFIRKEQLPENAEFVCKVQLANAGAVYIEYGRDVIYGLMSDAGTGIFVSGLQKLKIHAEQVIGSSLIKSQGKSIRAEFKSNAPHIATIMDEGMILWRDKGTVTFEVMFYSMNDDSLLATAKIPITVIQIPFARGADVKDVVKTLGFPDTDTEVFWRWPQKSGFFENVWYSFSSSTHGRTIRHLSYKKYPHLKLRFDSIDKLWGASNVGRDILSPRITYKYLSENL